MKPSIEEELESARTESVQAVLNAQRARFEDYDEAAARRIESAARRHRLKIIRRIENRLRYAETEVEKYRRLLEEARRLA